MLPKIEGEIPHAISRVSAGIWYWGLLQQARENGGTVTISIPSLDLEINLTEDDIQTAIERSQNPEPKTPGIKIIEGKYSEVID